MRLRSLFRICARQGDEMSTAIALEAQRMVREAAGDVAGKTVRAQIREAARSLGYPSDSWRISAAWYGHAGCWSAQAIRDLQTKFNAWRTREAARAQHNQMVRARRDRDALEAARAECRQTLADLDQQLSIIDRVLGPSGSGLDRT